MGKEWSQGGASASPQNHGRRSSELYSQTAGNASGDAAGASLFAAPPQGEWT